MLTFLLYTVLCWIGVAAFVNVMYQSIQQGEWLDKLFGWQAMLDRLYSSQKPWKRNLAKPLGDCAFCFSHALTFVCFWWYVALTHSVLKFWISWPAESVAAKVLINIGWYILFGSVGTWMGTMVIFKRTKKEADK